MPVRQGDGAGPPAGVIMAGGQRRPRFPSVGDRCRYGRVTELARQLGVIMAGASGDHGSRALETGAGTAGCQSWSTSWGDHGRWAPVP